MSVKQLIGMAVSVLVAATIMVCAIPEIEATEIPEDAEIADQGEFWSLKIYMMFNGSDAETIEWDFGDGSPVSTEWSTNHTYAAPGDYIVTQTVWNSYNGGSTAVTYYLLHVMGNPYVEYVMPDGAPTMDRVYVQTHDAAVRPADPVWEGHEFLGWYADEELTVPMVWPTDMTAPLTVYASYSSITPIEHTLTIIGSDGTVADTVTVRDGQTATMPVAPEGKTVTYYTDSDRTTEFDWTTPVTSDVTVYQTVSDGASIAEDSDKPIINGTDLAVVVGFIIFGIAAVFLFLRFK